MSYQFVGHVADARIKVESETLEELFVDAFEGTMDLLNPNFDSSTEKVKRIVKLNASDVTLLLIDFLNKVLLNAHTNKEAYNKITLIHLDKNSIKATLHGSGVKSFGENIKAVTYHEADVHKNDKWETNIVYDI